MKQATLALMLVLTATAAWADTLVLNAAEAASATIAVRPVTGHSMENVRQRFGQPEQALSAVGDPPITRWVYSDFTVYFEYDRVINTVPHR